MIDGKAQLKFKKSYISISNFNILVLTTNNTHLEARRLLDYVLIFMERIMSSASVVVLKT